VERNENTPKKSDLFLSQWGWLMETGSQAACHLSFWKEPLVKKQGFLVSTLFKRDFLNSSL
jgi:hypothetical protein